MIKSTPIPRIALALSLACGAIAISACADNSPTGNATSSGLDAGRAPAYGTAPAPMQSSDSATYTFVIQPGQSYRLQMKSHRLDLPANAICDLQTSGYGTDSWDKPCTPSAVPVTITARVKGTEDLPFIEFSPELRFNPTTNVVLNVYVAHPKKNIDRWQILYCNSTNTCIDENAPASWDNADKLLFRRIKHFSGYMIAE